MFAAGKTAAVSGGAPDDKFNYVTMLLHGDGTNGAQNNTFVDSSTNNFTITRNGNTTQGSFSPYGSNWSNYFNGSSDYLTAPSNAAFAFGTGAWTVEAWVYLTAQQAVQIFDTRSSVSTAGVGCRIDSNGTLYYSGSANNALTSSNVSINTWTHVAWVYDGTTLSGYINGVRGGTATPSFNITQNNGYIGRVGFAAAEYMPGYISNLRVVKGSAVYSGASFTVPTTPLTAIANTSLLTCQSNRFVDNSTNNFTLTVNGTPSVQRFNPFGASTAYSTSVIGGSGYFDGSGDYLSIASNSTFATTSGNTMTYEAWVYPTRIDTEMAIFSRQRTTSPYTGYVLGIRYGYPAIDSVGTSGTSGALDGSTLVKANQWNYIVWQFDHDGNQSIYLNGTRIANATGRAVDPSFTIALNIGMYNDNSSQSLYGYVSNARFIKQTTAYYSGTTITVPTAPLTAVTNTQLLNNFTNGAIFDNAMMNDLETVGNAQISTSVVKYGTGSLKFDGTGDWLVVGNPSTRPILDFGAGDFTIEAWVYPNGTSTYLVVGSLDNSSGIGCWWLVVNATFGGGGTIQFGYNTTAGGSGTNILAGSGTLSTSTWSHIAVTRNGSSIRCFVNGTQAGTTNTGISTSAIFPVNQNILVGETVAGPSYGMNGYIDDLRITKGYARYTTTFTPPTKALSDTGP